MKGMVLVAVLPAMSWLCVLLATPRRPAPGNEVAELVYARLRGRHQRVILLALIATAATVFMGIGTAMLASFNP